MGVALPWSAFLASLQPWARAAVPLGHSEMPIGNPALKERGRGVKPVLPPEPMLGQPELHETLSQLIN